MGFRRARGLRSKRAARAPRDSRLGSARLLAELCPPEPTSAHLTRAWNRRSKRISRDITSRRRIRDPESAGSNPAPATRKAPETGLFFEELLWIGPESSVDAGSVGTATAEREARSDKGRSPAPRDDPAAERAPRSVRLVRRWLGCRQRVDEGSDVGFAEHLHDLPPKGRLKSTFRTLTRLRAVFGDSPLFVFPVDRRGLSSELGEIHSAEERYEVSCKRLFVTLDRRELEVGGRQVVLDEAIDEVSERAFAGFTYRARSTSANSFRSVCSAFRCVQPSPAAPAAWD
jgi:hypothetical protein